MYGQNRDLTEIPDSVPENAIRFRTLVTELKTGYCNHIDTEQNFLGSSTTSPMTTSRIYPKRMKQSVPLITSAFKWRSFLFSSSDDKWYFDQKRGEHTRFSYIHKLWVEKILRPTCMTLTIFPTTPYFVLNVHTKLRDQPLSYE